MKRIAAILVLIFAVVAAHATVTTGNLTVSFTCTGSTGPFPFTFPISDPTALTVTQNGTVLSSSAYTMTPVNNNYSNGGSVTLNSSCPNPQPLVLTRISPVTQTSVFADNMPIPMKTIENGLDKLTEIEQEQSSSLHGLWMLPIYSPTSPSGTCTDPDQVEYVTGNGSPYIQFTCVAGIPPALPQWVQTGGGPTSGTACGGDNTIANGCTGATTQLGANGTLGIPGPVFNVIGYGAIGDCTTTGSTGSCTDNCTALQAAINNGATKGIPVYLPANVGQSSVPTVYYTSCALNPKGVSIYGPPGGFGGVFYPAVSVRGAPGNDVFDVADPTTGGYSSPAPTYVWQDFGIIIDDSVDVSASNVHRKPGKTCNDITATSSSAVITSTSQCEFNQGDVGQAVSLTDGTNTLATTISSVSSFTSATLAATWPHPTHTSSTIYVSVMGLSTSVRVGNCGLAYDDYTSAGSTGPDTSVFRNLRLVTVSGTAQNNSCAFFFQGNGGQPYASEFKNIFYRTYWGFTAVEADAASHGNNGALGDLNHFDNVVMDSTIPLVTYDGDFTRWNGGQIARAEYGPQILNYGAPSNEYVASDWHIENEEWEVQGFSSGLGWRIDGKNHIITGTALATTNFPAQWDATNSKCESCYGSGTSATINLTGGLNKLQFSDGADSVLSVNDTGFGNLCSRGRQYNPFDSQEPSLYLACSAVNSRQNISFAHTSDFVSNGNETTTYNNQADLWLWPQDLTATGAVSPASYLVVPDSASETGTHLNVFSGEEIGFDHLNTSTIIIGPANAGPNLPATEVHVCWKAKADSGSGTSSFSVYANSTLVATASPSLTTAYSTTCYDANLTSYSGDLVTFQVYTPTVQTDLAWISVHPWADSINSIGPINGSVFDVAGSPLATGNLADWTNGGVANGNVPVWNSGTGKWTPGAPPAAGVSSINSATGAFTFSGSGVSCTGTTCTFSGSGSGIGSITWSVPAYMSASPSTISASGTQTFGFNSQTANQVFAGPGSGSAALPGFRALVSADIPNNGANTSGNAGTATLATTATNLGGTGTDYAPYQSASATTSYITAPTTSGHTFAYAWQPSGSAVAPTAVDITNAVGLSLIKGTYTNGDMCTYASSGTLLNCNTAIPSSLPPSGSAGGDLSGSYPNPTVAQVNGAVVPASAQALASNSSRQLIAATLAGAGSGLTTGPTSSTSNDAVTFTGTGGQIQDAGFAPAPAVACTTVSSLSPASNGCYNLSTSSSVAMPSASAFSIFTVNTASGQTATFTGTTLTSDAGCSSYLSGTTLALTGNQSMVVKSDGTHIWASCTVTSAGTINNAAQYDVPYYSASGTTNTMSGTAISGFQFDTTGAAPTAATAAQLGGLANLPQYSIVVSGGTSAALTDVATSSTTGAILASGGSAANPAYDTTAVLSGGAITMGASGTAGTYLMYPASGNFTTTLGTAATANNTFLFPVAAPTNLHCFYAAVSGTTTTLTDCGYAYNSIPNADLANSSVTFNGVAVSLGSTGNINTSASGDLLYSGGSGAALNGTGDFTFATHTLSGGASAILDLHAAPATTGLLIPSAAGAIPTADGQVAVNTTTHANVHGSNGTTIVEAAAATGTGTSTACSTHNWVSTISSIAAPTCTQPAVADVTGAAPTASPTFTGTVTYPLIATTTHCAGAGTAANPSVASCSAAPSGFFSCATNASTGTCQVNTTAVTANSVIQIQPDSTLGTALSVTCNTTADSGLTAPRVSARSAGTSFTITMGTYSTNPECFSYLIIN